MKIVLIGGQEIPGIGGAEAYMLNLAKSLHAKGHNVTLICSARKRGEFDLDGLAIVYIVCPKNNFIALPLLFFKSLVWIIKNRKDIDLINYQSVIWAFIPGWISYLAGCKVCYTIHSLAEDNSKYNAFMRLLIKINTFLSIWLCNKNIFTVSYSKAREIKQRYGKKAAVIPCGVNLPKGTYTTDILERFSLKTNGYYLVIGRIDPIKNLDVLIKAFKKKEDKNLQLVIAGDYNNSYGEKLLELAKDDNRIVFVGVVLGDDKDTLLQNCYVNCLVSSSEGMPISLLEAMIYAKPCVVTDIPAIREVIEEENGYWCRVGDVDSLYLQMQRIEQKYDEAKVLAEKMSIDVKDNYLWNKIAEKYIAHLKSLGCR